MTQQNCNITTIPQITQNGWLAAECHYKEYNRLLTEQFISGLNDDGMIDEILKDVAMLEDIENAMSEHVLLVMHRVEAQRGQKSALNEIKEVKDFDIVK